MFVCFLFVFIPFYLYEESKIPHFTEEMETIFQENLNDYLFMVFPRGYDPSNDDYGILSMFSSVSMRYGHSMPFATIDYELGRLFIPSIGEDDTYLIKFYNNSLVICRKSPILESEFLFLLSMWFEKSRFIVSSTIELYQHIGNLPLTLLTRITDVEDAYLLVDSLGTKIDTCGVLVVTHDLMTMIGMGNSIFGLFRRDDLMIVPIKNSTESVLSESKPFYSVISPRMASLSKKPLACVFEDQFMKEDHHLLYSLAKEFPQFAWGVIEESYFSSFQPCLSSSIPSKGFCIFYPDKGLSYPFIQGKKRKNIENYLQQIDNGTITPSYLSDIDEKKELNGVSVVVGTSYQSFVENKDCILLYYGQSNDITPFFEAVLSANINISCGMIDTFHNFSPKPFPFFLKMPHVEAIIKNISYPMLENFSSSGIKRFFNRLNPEIICDLITKEEARHETRQLLSALEYAPESYKDQIVKYIMKLKKEIGSDLLLEPDPLEL